MPPVYARIAEESVDCHAVALAKADHFSIQHRRSELRLGKPKYVGEFFYVYIIQSELDPKRFYTGLTENLPERVKNYNAGKVRHTTKWKPWRLKAYVALSDRKGAAAFEHYLKSASGRAFLKKRF